MDNVTLMPYSEARQWMQTGDLLGTYDQSFISQGIRHVTCPHAVHPITHVCSPLLLGGRSLVLETTAGGILHHGGVSLVASRRWIHERLDKGGVVWWWKVDMPIEAQRLHKDFLMRQLGCAYESPLAMLFRVALKNRVPQNNRWFCSEIETRARLESRPRDIKKFLAGRDVSQIWPVHLANHYSETIKPVQIVGD